MYLPPARNIDFDKSTNPEKLKNGWHTKIADEIEKYINLPRVLDPLKATDKAIQDSVVWSGFPRALDSWYNIENQPERMREAHKAAEIIYKTIPVLVVNGLGAERLVEGVPFDIDKGYFLAPLRPGMKKLLPEDAFGLAQRPQDEYLEWHSVKDPDTGAIKRIDFTSEPPEYWEYLADSDPALTLQLYRDLTQENVDHWDIFFPGDVYCPKITFNEIMQPVVSGYVKLADHLGKGGDRFRKGAYNPSNVWNTDKGAIHLIHTNNTLFAEINLAANATQKFSHRTSLGTPIDRFNLIAGGGYGGINRNSDPSIGEFVNSLALGDHSVMVSNPIGLFIAETKLGGFKDPKGNSVDRDQILTTVRGKWDDEQTIARVLRFSVHPPVGVDYSLDQCTFNGHQLDTGGPIARETLIAVHGIAQPNDLENPFPENKVVQSEGVAVEHPTLRPTFYARVNWFNQLAINVPEETFDPETTRSKMLLSGIGRGI